MFVSTGSRLVLRFARRNPNEPNPGQFSFRKFAHTATDQQLYDLAHQLNAFQEDNIARVLKVYEFEMSMGS
jgi:hypothetical protein